MLSRPLGIRREYRVETQMRDGTILRSTVVRPDVSQPVPAILVRSPYGTVGEAGYEPFARAGYAVVAQDSRGRYTSDGTHINFCLPDNLEAEDGYDTVEWIAEQPWCNDRVGIMGSSYCGYMAWETARLQPPHLQALAASTIPQDLSSVDFTQGSFRPARRVHWWLNSIAPDLRKRAGWPKPHTSAEAKTVWALERARWLEFLPWSELPEFFPEPLASQARAWLEAPHKPIWRLADCYRDVILPNLDTSGWYDHCNGTIDHLAGMQADGGSELARRHTRLILGPWNHGSRGESETAGFVFGYAAAVDLTDLHIRWFNRWLKDQTDEIDDWPPVQYFMMGEGAWKAASTWPPPDTSPQSWYLAGDDKVGPDCPPTQATTSYTYDPRDPVPTLWSERLLTVPSDRHELDYRQDILRFLSPPLEEPLSIAGYPEAVIYATSSAVDTDFFVRLIDETPEGVAFDLCHGMVRARHRNSWEREDFLVPGEVTEFRLRLGAIAHCFRPGHRLRIDITSSDFPNYDRNHNTGGNDLTETTMQVAEQTVICGGTQASRIELPVLPEA